MSPRVRGIWACALLLGLGAVSLRSTPAHAFDPLQRAARAVERSRAAFAAGDTSKAVDEMLRAQALAPDDSRVRHALGELYYDAAQYPSAGRVFEGLSRADALAWEQLGLQSRDLLYNTANAAFEQQDYQQALELYTEALLSTQPEEALPEDLLYNLELTQTLLDAQSSSGGNGNDSSDKSEEPPPDQDQNQDQPPSDEQQPSESEDEQGQDQDQADNQDSQEDQPKPAPNDSTRSQSEPDSSQAASADSLQVPPETMSAEEAMRLLEALDHDEEELRASIQRRLRGGESEDNGEW